MVQDNWGGKSFKKQAGVQNDKCLPETKQRKRSNLGHWSSFCSSWGPGAVVLGVCASPVGGDWEKK